MRLLRLTLATFLVLQLADGLITFAAVRLFGPVAEGNPILQTWIELLGPAVTLIAAKAVACAGGTLLYVAGRKKTLAALTALLACSAVAPWLELLSSVT